MQSAGELIHADLVKCADMWNALAALQKMVGMMLGMQLYEVAQVLVEEAFA